MSTNKEYQISLTALSDGEHDYHFHMNNAFFQELEQDEIQGGDVDALVHITARGVSFVLQIDIKGKVIITCDRCLDPMEQEVDSTDKLLVKLGISNSEDEVIYVSPDEGILDLSWLLYEQTELSLPIVHRHQEGMCNPQMEELLRSHLCTEANQNEDN